jgi:hypothetical protein
MEAHINKMNRNFTAPIEDISRLQIFALGAGVIGLIALLVGAFLGDETSKEQALRGWLIGFVFWGGIGIGSVGILTLQYLTGGSWGLVIRRILEAGTRTLPLVALMFAPIFLGASLLYEWTHVGNDKVLIWKAPYLNPTLFLIRAIIYFAFWSAVAYFYNKWSHQQDQGGDNWNVLDKAGRIAGPTMVFFALAVSFAAIDWVMSLDPHWFSTIFGLLYLCGWGLSTFSFVIALSAWLATKEPMNRVLGAPHFHDLGKLTLALVMVWAYFNFSQYLIIWSGNLPEETPWFIRRQHGGWGIVGLILVLFHFAFPFLLLLSRDLKRNARYLSWVAIFVLIMRIVDLFWQIAPNKLVTEHSEGLHTEFSLNWMYFAGLIGVGGIWLWYFFHELKKYPLMPPNDPYLEKAIEAGIEHH